VGFDKVAELERTGQFNEVFDLIKTLPEEYEFSTKLIEIRILLKQGQFKQALSKTEEIYYKIESHENPTEVLELIILITEIQIFLGNPNQSKHYLDLIEKHLNKIDPESREFVSFSAKNNLVRGLFFDLKSDFKKALQFFDSAEKLFERVNDELGHSTVLFNIGRTLQKQGNLVVSLDRLQESLRIRETVGNPYDILENLNIIGIVNAKQGYFDDAIMIFERSLGICEDIDNLQKKSKVLNNLGSIAKIRGNLRLASFYNNQSLQISEQIGDMNTFIISSINLGSIELDRGDLDNAINIYSKILPILKKSENKQTLATVFNNMGLVYEKKGELNSARHYYQISLDIRQDLDNIDDIGKSLQNVGKVYLLQGKIEEAFTNLSKAYEIFDTNKNYNDLSEVALKLGLIYSKKGEFEYAEQQMMESLKLREASGNDILVSDTLFFLVILYRDMDEPKKAEKYLMKLNNIAKKSKNKVIKTRHKLAEATLLQTSHKITKKAEAHDLFEEVVNQDLVDFELTVFAMLNLCEFLLIELKTTNDEETLKEIDALVTKLYEIAQDQESYDIMCEVLIIQSKLALLEAKYKEANFLIDQAITIADERNIHQIKIKSTFIKKQLETQLDKWSETSFEDLPLSERIDELELHNYIQEMYERKENTEMFVHDIRNFLQMNLNITKLISLNEALPEDLRGYVDLLEKSGREIQMHISSFMTQEKLDNASYNLNYEKIDLTNLVDERLELFKVKVQMSKLTMDIQQYTSDLVLDIDRFLLSRSLDNLIHNALKFAPKESIIQIALDRDEKDFIFSITNDGPAIPKEDHERLFMKYEQIRSDVNKKMGGFGLGLAFCKKAIEEMKGTIGVESPIPDTDQGVTFTIKLPR
jgi:signal transduction histidine kinase/Tfp pilus assembly protein PilF